MANISASTLQPTLSLTSNELVIPTSECNSSHPITAREITQLRITLEALIEGEGEGTRFIDQQLQDSNITLEQAFNAVYIGITTGTVVLNKSHTTLRSESHVTIRTESSSFANLSKVEQEELSLNANSIRNQYILCKAKTLKAFHLSNKDFDEFSSIPDDLKLEPDTFLLDMTTGKVESRLIQLQEITLKQGFRDLRLKQLRPVVSNIIKCISFYSTTYSNKLCMTEMPKVLLTLTQKCSELLDSGYVISYTETMCLCIQYSLIHSYFSLFELPESMSAKRLSNEHIENAAINILDANFDTIAEKAKLQWDKLKQYISPKHKYPYNFEHIAVWIENNRFLIWPTFESLGLKAFNNMSIYNIFIAGMTPQKLCYHDSQLMLPIDLFGHDFAHASFICQLSIKQHPFKLTHYVNEKIKCLGRLTCPMKNMSDPKLWTQEMDAQKSNDFLLKVESQLKQFSFTDLILSEAIDVMIFCARHEIAVLNPILIGDDGSQVPIFLHHEFIGRSFHAISHFDFSPEIELRHLQMAIIILTYVTYSLITT